MAKKKDLQATVEAQLADMLASNEEPSEGRMKLLALGIKMVAVKAKLEESEYGDFFSESHNGLEEQGETKGISKAIRREKQGEEKGKSAPSASAAS